MVRNGSPLGVGLALSLAGWATVAGVLLSGCAGVRPGEEGGGGRTGVNVGGGGRGGRGVDPGETTGCKQDLRAVVRDFRGFTTISTLPKHPDFEYNVQPVSGLVAAMIGADGKP